MNDDWKGEHFLKITPSKNATGSADTRMFMTRRSKSGKFAKPSGKAIGGLPSGRVSSLVGGVFRTDLEGDNNG